MSKLDKKTLDRIRSIRLADEKVIKQKEAAEQLGMTPRQVRRLITSYQQKGEAGLLSDKVRQQAISLIEQRYPDFGPTLACEQSGNRHQLQLQLSVETVRQLMIGASLWKPHKTKEKRVHQRRERRPCCGELIQIDGSIHDWFEAVDEKAVNFVVESIIQKQKVSNELPMPTGHISWASNPVFSTQITLGL